MSGREKGGDDYISSYSFLPGMMSCQETIFGVFLGAFAKLRKATIIFNFSVSLSIRMEQLCFYWKDFHEI